MSYGYLAQSVVAQVDRVLSRKLRPVLCDVLLRFGLRVGCASPLDGLRQDVSSLGVASESAVKSAAQQCMSGRGVKVEETHIALLMEGCCTAAAAAVTAAAQRLCCRDAQGNMRLCLAAGDVLRACS